MTSICNHNSNNVDITVLFRLFCWHTHTINISDTPAHKGQQEFVKQEQKSTCDANFNSICDYS